MMKMKNEKPTIRKNRLASLYNINIRLAPLYNFMTETMMTQDFSNPLVYWSVMGEMMSHFEVFFNIDIIIIIMFHLIMTNIANSVHRIF